MDALSFYCNAVANEPFVSSTLQLEEKGIEGLESDDQGTWRWAEGPATTVSFATEESKWVTLDMKINNPFPGQELTLVFNGEPVYKLANIPAQKWLQEHTILNFTLRSKPGNNELLIQYGKWNGKSEPHGQVILNSQDKRPLAVAFEKFLLNVTNGAAVLKKAEPD